MVVAWHFGYSWMAMGGIVLTWALIALAFIDYDTQLLPDVITLPLIWLGLMLSLGEVFVNPQASIVGGVAGYLSLWSVYYLFKLLTGKEGMGFGDFKLLSALGTWLGWKLLPVIILLSSLAGAILGVLLIVLKKHNREKAIPFGPYLAIAGWMAMLWGEQIIDFYLSVSGL
jgi:leader peptidase (prepilin peptidase)/N-methyltransferase